MIKIDSSSAVAATAAVERSTKTTNSSAVAKSSLTEDRTTFTSTSASVKSLVGQALSAPEVRQDKVNTLRQSISSGEYKIDSHKIAAAIISEGGN